MRRSFLVAVLVLIPLIGACSKAPAPSGVKTGAAVTVTMKDGSTINGRLVEARADQIVVDPSDGGEWKTLPRNQVASVTESQAATAPLVPAPADPAAQPAPLASDTAQAQPSQGAAPRTSFDRPRSTPSPSDRAGAPAAPARDAVRPPEPSAPPRPEFREVTVPANTLLRMRLDTALASDKNRVEDQVRASITRAVTVDEVEVVPAGSELKGVVTDARASGKVKGRAGLSFRFDTLSASGDQYAIRTQAIVREAESTTKKDAMKVGIPAAGGAIVGAIIGGKKGAAIGGAVGGGAGTAAVLTTAGEELRLPAGTTLTVRLLEPLTVRVPVSR